MGKDLEVEPEESSVLQYVEAATKSSDRVRIVMIVMVTASVLAFVGFRNSRPGGGWLDHRINIRKDALKLFDKDFDPHSPSLTAEEKERYARAKQYLDNSKVDIRNPDDKQQVFQEVQELRKVRIEKIRLIQVPFFGAAFDMNDMGVFAGITFAIVLLWVRFSLSRQLSNFRLAFKAAEKQRKSKLCYELLAMQQVLSVPPIEGEKQKRIWRFISKALFIIPVLILIELFRLNWVSRSFGGLLSEELMTNLLIVNGISVAVCSILTWQCLSLSNKADKLWQEEARKVFQQEKASDG